jgi:hypothetical protein
MNHHHARSIAMKIYAVISLMCLGLAVIGLAMPDKSAAAPSERIAQAKSDTLCAQVISCGTKNGTVKEYPTPCAARDDGATDVHPKSGPSC